MKIGTTFSYKECQFLKIDPDETLRAIAKLGLSPIRIGTYWQDIEPQPGIYDFSLIDNQLEILTNYQTKIVLEVGMKAPRWPEYYLPNWLEEHPINSVTVKDELSNFLKTTLSRYQANPQIKWINLENEPLTYSGPQEKRITPQTLKKELELVKSITKKPIILNTWLELHPRKRFFRNLSHQEKSLKTCLKLSNILGISVYPKYPSQATIKKKHWGFLRKIRESAKQKNKKIWVTEMQAEPWEKSDDLKNFSDPDGNPSCGPNDIISYFNILKSLGYKNILFWGAEFWYRCLKEDNHLWWNTVSKLVKQHGKN